MPTARNSSTGPTFDERRVADLSAVPLSMRAIDIPFLGSAAISRGELTRNDLRTRYRPVFRDVYIPRDVELTAAMKARAAWLSTGATVAGLSAAAVLGTKWLDANVPAEIVRADRHRQPGMIVHSYELAEDEVCVVRACG